MNNTFFKISQSKQQTIINVAFKHFVKHGYENTSSNLIIKELDISNRSLIKYFSTKLELYSYLVEIASTKLLSHIEQHQITGKNWRQRLMSYAAIEFDFLIKNHLMYKFFNKVGSELHHPNLASLKEKLNLQANCYLNVICKSIKLPASPNNILKKHVAFILKGYNESVISKFKVNSVTVKDKQNYLNGLQQHLEFICENVS
ncbi:TetR/AcrR family transcriptional regulator [Clostridium sp. 'deep sea']|uniref:TetR/AcrR family transcriptional regulator n=1 Tax=Clostridium sp. 'deep sea' TaxID=2779445 RepID=UPI0018966FBA|nr:TetR/AcrR family transcriptional regulator [Clostridium sp. 'deep sea']QOR36492.1 TetR/AcrR family transcriptional regulator [Clostridium sp. 'deep sea']